MVGVSRTAVCHDAVVLAAADQCLYILAGVDAEGSIAADIPNWNANQHQSRCHDCLPCNLPSLCTDRNKYNVW